MTKRDDSSKQSASDLAKSWGGHSTFRPLRHAEDDDDLDPMGKQAGSGLCGFTKGIQTCVDVGIRKLSKYASKTASALWAKDPKSAEFLTTHVRKAGSMSAKALLARKNSGTMLMRRPGYCCCNLSVVPGITVLLIDIRPL